MEMSGRPDVSTALPPGKLPPYPLNRREGEPQNQAGRFGQEKQLFLLSEFGTQIVRSVAQSPYQLPHIAKVGRDSVVVIATGYGVYGLEIESRWE